MSYPSRRSALASAALASTALGLLAMPVMARAQGASQPQQQVLDELSVMDNAAQAGKQALGASTITQEDIARTPPANDISDIVRRQPGVNLTGNSASGQYGNNRQIDIRGMGPENTLIMVDGMPVLSRDSVRYGRSGERNTRGDSNWVPVEEIESIEVLRGPAAARYGSGSAGGVVNIITKGPSDTWHGSASAYMEQPEDGDYSNTRRFNASLSGPIAKGLSFRVYGNYNLTSADSAKLNNTAAGTAATSNAASGREGVQNTDVNGLVRWQIAPGHRVDVSGTYSRQGNRYAGEYTLDGSSAATSAVIADLAANAAQTSTMIRATGALNYQGQFSFGTAKLVAQYEDTVNRRLSEGMVGGIEGAISAANSWSTAYLQNWFVNGSFDAPFRIGGIQNVATVGFEFRQEALNDPYSNSTTVSSGTVPGLAASNRDGRMKQTDWAGYVEDNMILGRLTLTPGLRFDATSTFGNAASPSFNASWNVVSDVRIKGGIAYAFKAPNLYQADPNYLYNSRGGACPLAYPSLGGGCLIIGNADLKAERSLNTEIGVAYTHKGWNASVSYFHNDYTNKIIAGNVPIGQTTGGTARIFQWTNAPKALVEGFEGNLTIPVAPTISWNTNGTWMMNNKIRSTGEILSVVPDYTINSTLAWQPTKKIDLSLIFTQYGKQEPNTVYYTGAAATLAQEQTRPAYHIVGLSANFKVTQNFKFGTGVKNLFNKVLYRESTSNTAGANSYNEAGRSWWVSATASF